MKDFKGKNFSIFKDKISDIVVKTISPISKEIKKLKNLKKINWLKNNSVWHQRVIINGRVVKNNNSIILASNVIKKALGIKLDPKENVGQNQSSRKEFYERYKDQGI